MYNNIIIRSYGTLLRRPQLTASSFVMARRPYVCLHAKYPIHTPLPRPSTVSCEARPGKHVLVGATCQLGQHGLNCRTKAVPIEAAGALDIEPASNMRGTVSRKVGEHTGAHPNLTLLHSLLRTRRVCGMLDRLEVILPRCVRARGIAHLHAL